jgi:hypothetical protein
MKFYQEYIYSVSIHKCQFHNQTCLHKEYTSENRKIIIIILRGKHPSSSFKFFFYIYKTRSVNIKSSRFTLISNMLKKLVVT